MSDASYNDLIAELQVDYLASFPEKFALISKLLQEEQWHPLELEFHKLKGTGKTYGIPEVSIVCREMERLYRGSPEMAAQMTPLCLEILKDIQSAYNSKTPVTPEITADPRYCQLAKASPSS